MKRPAISSCSSRVSALEPAELALQREDDVLAHREVAEDALGLAVLRAEAEAVLRWRRVVLRMAVGLPLTVTLP